MTREQLKELITFSRVMKLENESLREVLLQKEVAELDGYHPKR
jgi:regulator of replication initiation timing